MRTGKSEAGWRKIPTKKLYGKEINVYKIIDVGKNELFF
jgi:hypothetical protein